MVCTDKQSVNEINYIPTMIDVGEAKYKKRG